MRCERVRQDIQVVFFIFFFSCFGGLLGILFCRSLFGLNYHLTTFDHDNPEQNTPVRKNRKSRGGHGTPKAALNDSAQ